MDPQIIELAEKEWQKIRRKYDGFETIIVDSWRGYRFIFDAPVVKNCRNNCLNCPVFQALKEETCRKEFSADLLPASENDKKLFGVQNFLNCKTLAQYQRCFANFLSQPNLSPQEIREELTLIQNLEILFSKTKNKKQIKKNFLKNVLQKVPLAQRKKIKNI